MIIILRVSIFSQTMFRPLLLLSIALLLGAPAAAEEKPLPKEVLAVHAHLARFVRYPIYAEGVPATVLVKFQIDNEGRLISSEVAASSCSEILDREALAVVARASPFPPPPPGEGGFTVPIIFQWKNIPVRPPRSDCPTPWQKDRERDRAIGLHPPE